MSSEQVDRLPVTDFYQYIAGLEQMVEEYDRMSRDSK